MAHFTAGNGWRRRQKAFKLYWGTKIIPATPSFCTFCVTSTLSPVLVVTQSPSNHCKRLPNSASEETDCTEFRWPCSHTHRHQFSFSLGVSRNNTMMWSATIWGAYSGINWSISGSATNTYLFEYPSPMRCSLRITDQYNGPGKFAKRSRDYIQMADGCVYKMGAGGSIFTLGLRLSLQFQFWGDLESGQV